ncbi:hypothetical protein R5R35_010486 [Gryllus longicercus]|uniref:Ran-specific GTPase-activating protein n=1 Tax=Gryllus longicercus TaxID=2509291 RepID=A0AAN9V5H9_9ORTH
MAEEQTETVENRDDSLNEHDPHYEPIISLPEVCIPTMEEEELEMIKLRAKLFRYDKNEVPPEWKERGTGDIKLLRHKAKNSVRVVMRRDKTLKLCANHYVTPWMELKPSHGSDRAWVYSVEGDYADGEMKQELLAVRFANPENAKKWREKFEEAKVIVETECDIYKNGSDKQLNESSETEESESENKEECEEKDEKDSKIEKEENSEKVAKEEKVIKELEKLKVEDKPEVSGNE